VSDPNSPHEPAPDQPRPPDDSQMEATPYGDQLGMTADLPDNQAPLGDDEQAQPGEDDRMPPEVDDQVIEVVETIVELVEVDFEDIAGPPPSSVHRFRFDTAFALAALPFGITSEGSRVEVMNGTLHARFGPWDVQTPVDNIAAVHRTGPFSLPRVIGPPRVSLADRGLTFASTSSGGLCIEFHHSVPGILPVSVIRHPALTVTVEDPDALARDLARAHR
jgi:hypothetical protein